MSAEVLRRAAALMRERAEAAEQGVWTAMVDGVYVNPEFNDRGWLTYEAAIVDGIESEDPVPTANLEHIASWHPAVALAVADWLEDASYRRCGCYLAGSFSDDCDVLVNGCSSHRQALAVARAYLR